MKRVSLPSIVPLSTIVFGLREVVKMGKVQLLCVVLCLAVAMANTQPKAFPGDECPQSRELVKGMREIYELLRKVSAKQLACPHGFQPNYSLESCYHFSQSKLSWNQAREKCLGMQGYLVEVESKEEDDFIMATIATTRAGVSHWLGGSDTLHEGDFRWSKSGLSFTYTHWYAGQPDNYGNKQHCAVLSGGKAWDDIECDYNGFFICEWN